MELSFSRAVQKSPEQTQVLAVNARARRNGLVRSEEPPAPLQPSRWRTARFRTCSRADSARARSPLEP